MQHLHWIVLCRYRSLLLGYQGMLVLLLLGNKEGVSVAYGRGGRVVRGVAPVVRLRFPRGSAVLRRFNDRLDVKLVL